jgi:hypothetical protein
VYIAVEAGRITYACVQQVKKLKEDDDAKEEEE